MKWNGKRDRITVQKWEASGDPQAARLVSVQDAELKWTTYRYDALDALVAVCGPSAIAIDPCIPAQATRTWTFDSVSHLLVSETHPESGTTDYGYRNDGLLRWRRDEDGLSTYYDYNENNRLDGEHANGPSGPLIATYEYDCWDNLKESRSPDVRTVYTYRGGEWLTRRSDTVAETEVFVSEYDYDPAGNVIRVHYPSKVNRAVNYHRDAEGRVTEVVDDTSEHKYASNITWHPSGAVSEYLAGNNLLHHVSFHDQTARPIEVVAGPLHLTYTYDATGSVRTIEDPRTGTDRFDYDGVDRLTSVTGSWGALSFTYKPSGDRESMTRSVGGTTATTTYAYDYTSHALVLTGATTGTFTYRGAGHLEQDPRGQYDYTHRGMLRQAAMNSGVTASYTYDGQDRRTTKTVTGTTSYYLHDGQGRLLSEYQQRGVGRDYIYLGDRLLAAVVGTTPAPPPACGPTSPPGTECADGTIVAGTSPDGNERMFTTPDDAELAPFVLPTEVTVGATSRTTGEANTALWAASASGGAAFYCATLVAHGKEDWYLPAADEMRILQQNAEVIRRFNPDPGTYYWTSTEKIAEDYTAGYFVRIGDGWIGHTGKGKRYPFRCVRRGADGGVLDFQDRTNQALGTVVYSNIVRVTSAGGQTVSVSVSGGEFRVCPDAYCASEPSFGTAPSTVGEGQFLQLRVTSSLQFSTPVQVNVAAGTLSDVWTVTTVAQDATPNPFAFVNQSGVALGTAVTSNVVGISGISGLVTVAILTPGAEYRVCSDASCSGPAPFMTSPSLINSGQYLQLRQTSASTEGTPSSATVSVGTASVTWIVTTAGDICGGAPPIGTVCADGLVYAGYSPDGNVRMFTTPEDAGYYRFESPETTGHGYTDRTTGKVNTLGMAQYPGYHAANYCAGLVAHGTDEWYLPGQYEMDVLYANREAVGGFDLDPATYYWTAREHDTLTGAYYHRMDGVDGYTGKGISFLIRCVWREMNASEFHFADQSGSALNVGVGSNILRVIGLRGSAPVSITGDGSSYRVCGDATCSNQPPFITTASQISDGQFLQLYVVTSDQFATTSSATISVGRMSDVWQVTTASQDVSPNAFTFADQTGAALSTTVTSNVVQISGITGSVATSVTAGAYRVCADSSCSTDPPFASAGSMIANGQYLQLRQMSAATQSTSVSSTVTVGTGSDTWTVTTLGDPCAGSPAAGTLCADGSKFAGYSPDGNGKMYTTVSDAGTFRFEWPETTGHGYTDRTTGESNTLGMAQYSGYAAARYCAALVAYGKDDWYLPGQYEMDVLHANRVAIGGFNTDPTVYYWTAREHATLTGAYYHRMDGVDGYTGKGIAYRIRCVRKD